MEQVKEVRIVAATVFDLIDRKVLHVGAIGIVGRGGYSDGRLEPRVYITPPDDGTWDFDMVAAPPAEVAIQVETPIGASFSGVAADWLKCVRVHAAQNALVQEVIVMLNAAPHSGGGPIDTA